MNPFHTIAIPHQDILENRLTLDVFATDLWEVVRNHGASEAKLIWMKGRGVYIRSVK